MGKPILQEAEYEWVQGPIESNAEEFLDSLTDHERRSFLRTFKAKLAHAEKQAEADQRAMSDASVANATEAT